MFAPEGLPLLVIPAIVLFLFAFAAVTWKKKIFFAFSGVALLFWIAMLVFFRDPVRVLPETDSIVAPTDGEVVILEVDSTGWTHVAIFLALTDVHAIRAPIAGKVVGYEFVPGSFLRADNPESGIRNQHARLDIETPYGVVEMKAISGAVARRVLVHPRVGAELEPGLRIGFVRFGSRCEMMMPPGFIPEIKVGDRMVGGVTPFGRYDIPAEEPQTEEFMMEDEAQGA